MSVSILRLMNAAGFDRAVSASVLMRVISACTGLVTLLLIAERLTKIQQGFYFTFGTIVQFQLDFGLFYVVMQVASREMAWLQIAPNGTLQGDPQAKTRLARFVRTTARWYLAIGLAVVLVILPAGWSYLQGGPDAGKAVWQAPWVAYCVAVAGFMGASALLSLLEGLGLVAEIAVARLVLTIVGSIGLWIALYSPNGLYAAAANIGLCWLSALIWVGIAHGRLLVDLLSTDCRQESDFSWSRDVWPFQWRVGASWCAGYFMTFFFVPVLYRSSGATEAGRMGMMLQILVALSGLAVSWVSTKAPTFGKLIADRRFEELDRLFADSVKRVLVVAVLLGLVWLAGIAAVQTMGLHIASRLLPLGTSTVLVLAMLANCTFNVQVVYLRAYCREPLLVTSVIMGAAVAVLTVILVPSFGTLGASLLYLGVLLVGSVVAFRVLTVRRREWQAQPVSGV